MSDKTAISFDMLERFRREADPECAAARAVASVGLAKAGLNQEVLRRHDFVFNTESEMGKITAQKHSGRCWMFAAMNTARVETMKKLNLEDFHFSKVYPLFWDKLEKANYFLESILDTLDEPRSGRLVSHLLQAPVQDGGQWDMYAGILEKYGAVPESAMPETFHSSDTHLMVETLTRRLRAWACELRYAYEKEGLDADALRKFKEKQLENVYRLLVRCLGEPPKRFSYAYYDKDKKYHRLPEMTPVEFFREVVGWNLADKVSLINAPTKDKPYGRVYTVKYLGTVREAKPIHYLNVPIDVLKEAAVAALKDGEPVWFGCDVGKFLLRDQGIMDLESIDYEAVAGPEPKMTKAQRLEYGESVLTHAMVFTGVELDEAGRPVNWKVENSWSEDVGHKGVFSMSDEWFEEYNYEIMVDRKYIPAKWLKGLESPVIELEPWDPMGALAR